MQAAIRWAALAFITAFAGAQFVRPDRTNPPSEPSASLLRHAPPEVSAILERSCRDCHSNETTWPWYSGVAPMSWGVAGHVHDGREIARYPILAIMAPSYGGAWYRPDVNQRRIEALVAVGRNRVRERRKRRAARTPGERDDAHKQHRNVRESRADRPAEALLGIARKWLAHPC